MKSALIVGRSRGAMEEYQAALALATYDAVIVIGKMGEAFPDPIDYWSGVYSGGYGIDPSLTIGAGYNT